MLWRPCGRHPDDTWRQLEEAIHNTTTAIEAIGIRVYFKTCCSAGTTRRHAFTFLISNLRTVRVWYVLEIFLKSSYWNSLGLFKCYKPKKKSHICECVPHETGEIWMTPLPSKKAQNGRILIKLCLSACLFAKTIWWISINSGIGGGYTLENVERD